jgi:CHAD domain-containing protein
MKWKSSQNVSENARAKLPKLVQKYFQAGRKAMHRGKTPKDLHQFRIKTKEFRYALELFRPIFGPTLERQIKSLSGIQDALGKISDYATIQEMVAGDKQLTAKLERAQKKKIREFRLAWKQFDADGQFKRWTAYLTRAQAPARRPVRARKTPAELAPTSAD